MPFETVALIFEVLVSVSLFALVPWAHGLMRALNAVEARLARVEAKLEERENHSKQLLELSMRVTHLEAQIANHATS